MADNSNNKKTDFWKKQNKKSKSPTGSVPPPTKGSPVRFSLGYLLIVLTILWLASVFWGGSSQREEIVPISEFKQKIVAGDIKSAVFKGGMIIGYTQTRAEIQAEQAASRQMKNTFSIEKINTGSVRIYKAVMVTQAGMFDPELLPLLEEHNVVLEVVPPANNYFMTQILPMLIVMGIAILLWRAMFKRMGGGANALNFGQNKNRIVAESDLKTSFSDVAGCDEAKAELIEVVDFLKYPTRYTAIGGKIPKGALLVGPPGTGKTLLARAVAGEAGVPFFKMSGSDFIEMFVGVGAARVRDLFNQAREKAPCIIFIDEMDAIGKSRANSMTSNDEREQTLNQLLVEMDGFDSTSGVIILAATNRPEVLDPALLRPGRFDRQVLVDRPDLKGREQILKIHSKGVKLESTVDLHAVAISTPGFVGADLANVVNEAALMAVRAGRTEVEQQDFNEAIEKSALGLMRKSWVMGKHEREMTAYHEMGHALVLVLTPYALPLRKVSIIPRGSTLGVMWTDPVEGRYSQTTEELITMIDVALGGRAAEEVVYGRITTGAFSDIKSVTEIARSMIMDHGMSSKFRNVAFSKKNSYSGKTQDYIDNSIAKLIDERYQKTLALLQRHRSLLEKLTRRILETETLTSEELLAIVETDEIAHNQRLVALSESERHHPTGLIERRSDLQPEGDKAHAKND
jgi:cell division protease FtsH